MNTLELFFANEVAGVSGTTRFYDIDGYEVDSPITTNGVCSGAVMPPAQMLACSRSVRRIEVVATGVGDVWIDTLTVNPWRARLGDRRGDRSAEDVGPAKPIAYASFSREVCLPLTLSAVCGETPAVQKVSYSYISHGIVRAAQ